MHLISALFFYYFTLLVALMPFRLMYILSDAAAWVLRKIIRYRRSVILDNLEKSDLNPDKKQKQEIIRRIYKNLADIILEGLKSFSMSEKSVRKRHRLINPEVVEPHYKAGKSVILVTGHIGNWEWGALSSGIFTQYTIIGFYKPLKNTIIDTMVKKSRSRFGCILASIKLTSRVFDKFINGPAMFLMAADQSPTKIKYAYWFNFLGRDTAFLQGPERHSRINKLPVIFADIRRIKRGHYEVELSEICDNPDTLKEGEITRIYATKLESSIRNRPDDWLWTHKRWKKKRSAETTAPQ